MFFIVTDQVVPGEAIVGSNKVNRGVWSPAGGLVKVRTTAQSVRDLIHQTTVTLPEPAHRITVAPIPFRPQYREASDLIAALPDVPRLGNELYLRNDWILVNDFEERGKPVFTPASPRAREARPLATLRAISSF
jgi:hypothetical protein